ncbi:MAG: hypothetical protein IIT67_08055 [Clostridia bacterium]|nr:hypothetical protein [Clostridia bacterium]
MTYYKIINDRMVFSTCKTLQLEDGTWVSNPSEETIFANGWQVYVPPIIPPQPELEPDYEQVIQAVKKFLSTETEDLTDEDALDVAALYPTWASKIDREVKAGERLWYDGKLYKVIQTHTASNLWTPDHTPAIYTEVSIEEWPEWKRPTGAHDAYNKGDKVTYNGAHYVSLIDANVYSPDEYPAGWEAQP